MKTTKASGRGGNGGEEANENGINDECNFG